MPAEYQALPVPGFNGSAASYTHREIMASTTPGSYTQRGVTLAANQGVVLAGTLVGKRTADKKYYIYDNSTLDGRDTAVGIVRTDTDTTGSDRFANILTRGIVVYSKLSRVDSPGLTDIGGLYNAAFDTLKF